MKDEKSDQGSGDEAGHTEARRRRRARKRLHKPSRDTVNGKIFAVLNAVKLWDVLHEHEALITEKVMSAYAELADVIAWLTSL